MSCMIYIIHISPQGLFRTTEQILKKIVKQIPFEKGDTITTL